MEKLHSEGKCVFCEKMYTKSGITRHLGTHLKAVEKEGKAKQTAYHLQINAGEMFLQLLVSSKIDFGDLDNFFRAIWLECCGHMSSFQVKGKRYNDGWDSLEFGEKRTRKVGKVFKKGLKIQYDYDFGSTTAFEFKVVNEYKINVAEGIHLLSRNEPLKILCHNCEEKAATQICSVCLYGGPSFFCDSCSKKHEKSCSDFEEYAGMPVVNSPRLGVCAYDGGTIDQERDGAWKE